jgi:hypothetical protein
MIFKPLRIAQQNHPGKTIDRERTNVQLISVKKDFFSDPDFPEQVCPEYGHHQGETPDNRTTDQRIDL